MKNISIIKKIKNIDITKKIKKISITKINYLISLFFYYFLGLFMFCQIPFIRKKYLPIWRFSNKMFISNPAVIFTSFFLPFLFIAILGSFFKTIEITPGVISQIPILVLCINIPMLIVEFRQSSILKRLVSSNIKKYNILLAFIFYGMLISIISSAFIFLSSILLYGDKTKIANLDQIALNEVLKDVHWVGFVLSYALLLVLASGIGMFVASISKNAMSAMAIGLFILIPGGFLSGQYLSPNMILSSEPLNYASYLVWQKYPSNLMIASFKHNIFSANDIRIDDFSSQGKTVVWLTWEQKILFFVLPLVASPVIFGLSLKTFKWSNR